MLVVIGNDVADKHVDGCESGVSVLVYVVAQLDKISFDAVGVCVDVSLYLVDLLCGDIVGL